MSFMLWIVPAVVGFVVTAFLFLMITWTHWIHSFDAFMIYLSATVFILFELIFFSLVACKLPDNTIVAEGKSILADNPSVLNLLSDPPPPPPSYAELRGINQTIADYQTALNGSQVSSTEYKSYLSEMNKSNVKLLFTSIPGYCLYATAALTAFFFAWHVIERWLQGLTIVTTNEGYSICLTSLVFIVEIFLYFVIIKRLPLPTSMQLFQVFVDNISTSFAYNLGPWLWDAGAGWQYNKPTPELTSAEVQDGNAMSAAFAKEADSASTVDTIKQVVQTRLKTFETVGAVIWAIVASCVALFLLSKMAYSSRPDVIITSVVTLILLIAFQGILIAFVLGHGQELKLLSTNPKMLLHKILLT